MFSPFVTDIPSDSSFSLIESTDLIMFIVLYGTFPEAETGIFPVDESCTTCFNNVCS